MGATGNPSSGSSSYVPIFAELPKSAHREATSNLVEPACSNSPPAFAGQGGNCGINFSVGWCPGWAWVWLWHLLCESICKLLPGSESPTIIPLEKKNKVAIHALCKEPVFWETMEKLKSNGASSILVMPVEKILN